MNAPSAPLVAVRDVADARVLTLLRPEAKNALSAELVTALRQELAAAAAAPQLRGLVLTGAGVDFCAGADLKALQQLATQSFDDNRADSRHLAALFAALHRHPLPIVAAVQGHALAGGAGLACVCDRVVAADDAKFGFTEARIGFVAAIVARFLVDRAGPRAARDLLLTARIVDAREALALGLADELAPTAEVEARALAWLASLRRCSRSSLALTKELLAELPGRPLDGALDWAADLNARTRATDDCREGVASILEKRKPRWWPTAP
ncbi:MAG: enoyl-CoA hydratase/isomerase family protein [Planctomycetes bacterium]|nr:enoyl-CoA hydratase/isomerase family protein [Planctomycetota bacterium]